MLRFLQAHATHPVPELALEMVWAQLASQMAVTSGTAGPGLTAGEPGPDAPTLGWCYLSDRLAHGAQAVLDGLRQRMPQVAWVGAVGAGVLATHVEYMDEPALVVMLCNLPPEDFRIFHGRQPLPALPRGHHLLPDARLIGTPGWRETDSDRPSEVPAQQTPNNLYLLGISCKSGPASVFLAHSTTPALFNP